MNMESSTASGALYCFDGIRLKRMISGVTISNGLGWSPDDRLMYYIDTPRRKVFAFAYDASSGEIGERRTVADFSNQLGAPDGMTVDEENHIWVAHWGGSRVSRWNPLTGRIVDKIDVPAPKVTSACFGGESLDELYLTTSRYRLSQHTLAKYPLSGGLFRIHTNVKGLQTNLFNDV